MFKNIVQKGKDKMLLISLAKALKSVNLYKEEEKIIAGYAYALKHANQYLTISLNALNKNKDSLTDKKLKKESSKLELNQQIFDNIVKMEHVLSKDENVKEMSNEFKLKFKEFKSIVKK